MANLKKNLAYNFLLSCSQVLLPIISIPYITRVLDPEGIGRVSFIDSLTYYFITIAEFGIVVYGIRAVARVKDNREALRKLVSELLVLHIITSCISLLIYSITVFVLWNRIGDMRLVLFSLSFLLVNFFACEWYFWGLEKFRYITFRSLTTRLLGLASIFILVKEPADYYIYYGIIVAAAVGNLLWNLALLFKEVSFTTRGINWRQHTRHTWVTYLISLFYSITIMLDSVLLGLVSTTAAVGFYALSIKIVRIGSTVLTDMFLVLYPRTVALLKEQRTQEVQQTILKSVQLIILLSVPACVGLFLLSEQFIAVFLGRSFISVSDNLRILALLPFIKSYSLFLSKQVLVSYDQEKLYLKSLVTGSLTFVMLTLILSWFYADRGACYAIVLAEIIILALNYYYVLRVAPALKIFDRVTLLHACLGVLLFIPLVWLITRYVEGDIPVLLLAIAVCVLVYFLFQLLIIKNKLVLSLYESGRRYILKR